MPKASATVAEARTPRHSPFDGHVSRQWPSADGTIGVRLAAGTVTGAALISTWPAGAAALADALAAGIGAAPLRCGDTQAVAAGLLIRTGPEEYLLISATDAAMTETLRRSIDAQTGSVADLAHARCRIGIEGDRCREALAKLFAIDLGESSFAPGQARLTGHHHVPCLLHRLATDRFDLYITSSYAADQLATLIDAALEYGVALRLDQGPL
jgi:heterotetrameric sarcosine oxidase gamma subunit